MLVTRKHAFFSIKTVATSHDANNGAKIQKCLIGSLFDFDY